MIFVGIGLLIIILHFAGIGPMANWGWRISEDLWKFVIPFVFALFWWMWADWSGYNKRREQEKMDKKKQDRREQNLEALGMGTRQQKKRTRGK